MGQSRLESIERQLLTKRWMRLSGPNRAIFNKAMPASGAVGSQLLGWA